jgi:hypothetical protein
MIITNEKWNDIIAETRTVIDKWNESARKHQKSDVFRIKVHDTDGYTDLLTEHVNGYQTERKIIAREIATGEMRRTTISKQRGHITGFKMWRPDPQAWRSLANKPAAEIVKRLKLTNFLMILGSHVTHVVGSEQGDAA